MRQPAFSIRVLCCGLLASILALGCSASEQRSDTAFDVGAIRDTVLALEGAMNEAVDALDCEAGLAAVGQREPVFVSGGRVVRTAAALRDDCERMVAGRTGATFAIDTMTANVLSRDVAYVVREGNHTIHRTDGSSATAYFVMTTIWHRQSDGWKMVHLHESMIRLPPVQEGG